MWKIRWRGGRKHYFLFLFFLAFSQLNLSWKFGLITFSFSLSKVSSLLAINFNNWRKTVINLVFLSVSWILTVKYCQEPSIFKFLFLFHLVIIFYSLSSHPISAWPLFLIVLHNGVKTYSREKGVIYNVYQNEE